MNELEDDDEDQFEDEDDLFAEKIEYTRQLKTRSFGRTVAKPTTAIAREADSLYKANHKASGRTQALAVVIEVR
jgi:hypothetical protein